MNGRRVFSCWCRGHQQSVRLSMADCSEERQLAAAGGGETGEGEGGGAKGDITQKREKNENDGQEEAGRGGSADMTMGWMDVDVGVRVRMRVRASERAVRACGLRPAVRGGRAQNGRGRSCLSGRNAL
jgi:hypothetical protein